MHLWLLLFVTFNFVCGNPILDYWKQVSKISVIKCQEENEWKNNFSPKSLTNQAVKSKKCEKSDLHFSFKGQVENYNFQGPGKLRIGLG